MAILYQINLYSISVVYNFRIAEVTRQPIFDKETDTRNIVLGLLFDQYQQKYCGDITQNFFGALGSWIYRFDSSYFRTDFAGAHVDQTEKCATTFTGNNTDDILFTFGHNFRFNKISTTISGSVGFPTHKSLNLLHSDVGTGQIGLAVQFDAAFPLSEQRDFLIGTRYLHFFPRAACGPLNREFIFGIGNVIDVRVAHNQRWNHHGLEIGFTQQWSFGATVEPFVQAIIDATNRRRTAFYGVYKYHFLINDIKNGLLFTISYGFDNKNRFSNKHIVTAWAAWGVSF